ncbi:hypothetical protein QUF88_21740 [Bacillus sp. DX1.1]|uniref:hypothetical protein n=1 Tax=unclassified Bacillus (in: firmicutes) TaxID=185979 RepID=UPI00256FB8D9|nr:MULTISPECIES: hypothetical protein [unclassified Bacillus (in: firmicutes)]MDM5156336.1 hypothetical protein [Bacillus sp. DX1.1]WJE80610.1 hypothetical protein QRE67_19275 [Bacillus sp. DX3.1]
MKSQTKLNYAVLIVVFIIAINHLLLPIFGINSSALLPYLLKISTLYILPWIFLYWFIRLVKAIESK